MNNVDQPTLSSVCLAGRGSVILVRVSSSVYVDEVVMFNAYQNVSPIVHSPSDMPSCHVVGVWAGAGPGGRVHVPIKPVESAQSAGPDHGVDGDNLRPTTAAVATATGVVDARRRGDAPVSIFARPRAADPLQL